jgi:hypothetical protein
VLGLALDGGFTAPEVVPPVVIELLAPLVVSFALGLLAEGAAPIDEALVFAPVEAIVEPDHQSRLARSWGEAFRYSSRTA